MAKNPFPRFAVLIDAENVSPKIATVLFENTGKLGPYGLHKIYGNAASLKNWGPAVAKHNILPCETVAQVPGKNASDIALVIDTMDLFHTMNLKTICLVSSDSDFAQLASRLRKGNAVKVYGFGEQKAPDGFKKACNKFVCLKAAPSRSLPPTVKQACQPQRQPPVRVLEKAVVPKKPREPSQPLSDWHLKPA